VTILLKLHICTAWQSAAAAVSSMLHHDKVLEYANQEMGN
jgi:hypothetical protein